MKKNLLYKSTLLLVVSMFVVLSARSQSKIHNATDLQRINNLRKYVEAHPAKPGETNAAIQKLKIYESELARTRVSDISISSERNSAGNHTHLVPVNDECSGAIMLTQSSGCVPTTGDITGATQSYSPDTCVPDVSPNAFDVWYKFVAGSANPFITVTGSTGFDPVVFLFDSCGGSIIGCADANYSGGTETISATGLTIGNTYIIRLYSYGSALPTTTTFDICVYGTSPIPVNDDMCAAIALTLNGPLESGNTSFASLAESPGDSIVNALGYNVSCSDPNNTTWYYYTAATTDTFYIVYTANSNFEAWLGVFSTTNAANPCQGITSFDSCVGGPASTGTADTAVIALAPATAGFTYLLMVDGVVGSVGPYSIQIVSSNPLGIRDVNRKTGSIAIYPNPTTGILNVDMGSVEGKSVIRVSDVVGNLLQTESIQNSSTAKLDVSKLANGIYFVKIENNNGSFTQKIILNR